MNSPTIIKASNGCTATLYCGDCLQALRAMPNASVQTCVTSPPYWGLRDYGVDGQIGLEETPDAYVARLVDVFREVRRCLRDDGTLWLNLGDSYCSTDKWGGGKNGNTGKHTVDAAGGVPSWACRAKREPIDGVKPKDLIGIPWRVAFALQADGWYLRSDIIWAKPNPMPESVTDRPTRSHEYIFLLSKNAKYYYDADAIKEPITCVSELTRKTPAQFGGADKHVEGQKQSRLHSGNEYRPDAGTKRNKRDVWTVAPANYPEAHFATFPPALIEPCVKAGCPAGGTVLDPFNGSGTTGLVALSLGCSYVGAELNPDYIAMTQRRIAAEAAQHKLAFTEAAK